ncbi:unnamed protein product [Dovyalis caffra]|uniref:BHLH domain-containing protein n=1 Tax=Dovyalis caffra TaxID=77055 RepID=A0AAV1SC34_9ROSI|nr:unnamed protein product [Dovyalis caffra]
MELVWESGQVLMRGLPTSRSCTSYCSHPIKNVDEVENRSDGYTTKRPRLGTVDAKLGDFPLIGDREIAKGDKAVQDDYHPELFSGLRETNFNMLSEHNETNFDKHITQAHVVPGYKSANSRPGKASEFAAEVPQLTRASNSQLHQTSLEQSKASDPILQGLPKSKLQQVDSGPDDHLGLQNFSPILRPSLPTPNEGSGATRPTSRPISSRLQQLKSNPDEPPAGARNLVESGQMVPTSSSKAVKYFRDQQDLFASQIVPTGPIARPLEALPSDEHSEAVLSNDATSSKRYCDRFLGSTSRSAGKTIKEKPDKGKSIDHQAATTSICSRGASNDPTSYFERRSHEDTEDTSYTSDVRELVKLVILFFVSFPPYSDKIHVLQMAQDVEEEEPVPARGTAGSKRKRAEVHNPCERRRRDKINKKMRALQDLIPNSNQVDKASMLDEAIDHIRSLQLQIQIMSMRTGLCMSPTMLPTGMQRMMIYAPQLAQFSPMGVGTNMRLMQMGVGCIPAPFSASAMFGPPTGQMPISVSQAPFIPLNVGGHSTQSSVPMRAMSGMASTPLEFLRSAAFSSPKDIMFTPKH